MLGQKSLYAFGMALLFLISGGLIAFTIPSMAGFFQTAIYSACGMLILGTLIALSGLTTDDSKLPAVVGLLLNGLAAIALSGVAWLAYQISHSSPNDWH